MAGGLGMGTAANAEEVKTSNKSGMSRECGISGNSGGSVRAAILLGEKPRVADAELPQALEVQVELLDAGERTDAHAMQRTAIARHCVEAGELDARGQQRLDAPTRVLVIREHAGLDEHGVG